MDTSIPPWLNVSPRDFLGALQAGHSLGLGIATEQARLNESAANRVNDFFTQQRAFAQRQAEQERQQALAVWETQQRMAMEAQRVAAQQAQAQAQQEALNEYRMGELELGRGRLGQSEAAAQALEDYRQRQLGETSAHNLAMEQAALGRGSENKIHFGPNGEVLMALPDGTVKELRQGTPKLNASDFETVTEEWPPTPAIEKIPARTQPKTWLGGFLGIGQPEAQLPEVPATPGTPRITHTRRIPIGAFSPAAGTQGGALTNMVNAVTNAPSPQVILPLPKSKQDLETGQVYQTSRGPARWDGEKFIKE